MPKWLDDIFAELPVIKAAPRSFAIVTTTVIVVAVGAIWFSMNWSYGVMLTGRDQQIAILRDRITAYEQKLQGATPDQAAGKIANLEQEVASLRAKEQERTQREWPALTPTQIADWSAKLGRHRVDFLAIFFTDQYSEQFRERLMKCLNKLDGHARPL